MRSRAGRAFAVVLLAGSLAACSPGAPSGDLLHSEVEPDADVWAAGDSLTSSALSWPYHTTVEVSNISLGYEGFITTRVRDETIGERIDHFVGAFGPPERIVIMGGRNDEKYGVSIPEVTAEIDRLDARLRSQGVDVRWIAPPGRVGLATPVTDGIGAHLRSRYPSRTVDCGPLLGTPRGTPALFEPDGMHPNAAGHALLTACVTGALGL